MSTIGSTGGAAFNPLVGSVAGSAGQQKAAGAQQAAAEGAQRAFEAQRHAQLQRSVDDVGKSAETGDRDADGREAWRWHQHGENSQKNPTQSRPAAGPDDDDRGHALDLNA